MRFESSAHSHFKSLDDIAPMLRMDFQSLGMLTDYRQLQMHTKLTILS